MTGKYNGDAIKKSGSFLGELVDADSTSPRQTRLVDTRGVRRGSHPPALAASRSALVRQNSHVILTFLHPETKIKSD